MKLKAVLALLVVVSLALIVSAEEQKMFIEGSLIYGEDSMSLGLVGSAKLIDFPISFTVSAVSLELPGWNTGAYGIGAVLWCKSSVFGGGIIPQENTTGAFGTVAMWNDRFYMSFLSFFKTLYNSYTRFYVEGAFQEGGIIQGRIEAISNRSYSTVISEDVGIFVRLDQLNEEWTKCVWFGFGVQAAWQGCANGSTAHIELGIRPGIRIDTEWLSLDIMGFYVWSDDGSEAWGVEATLHFFPKAHCRGCTKRASPSFFNKSK